MYTIKRQWFKQNSFLITSLMFLRPYRSHRLCYLSFGVNTNTGRFTLIVSIVSIGKDRTAHICELSTFRMFKGDNFPCTLCQLKDMSFLEIIGSIWNQSAISRHAHNTVIWHKSPWLSDGLIVSRLWRIHMLTLDRARPTSKHRLTNTSLVDSFTMGNVT